MTKTNSSLVCFMCLKRFKEWGEGNDGQIEQPLMSINFPEFTEKYLRIPANEFSLEQDKLEKSVCKSCTDFINIICQLYEDLCNIQAKLAVKVKDLSDLLENSTKACSDKMCVVLLGKLWKQMIAGEDDKPKDRYKVVENLRKMLAQQCKIYSRSHKSCSQTKSDHDANRLEERSCMVKVHVTAPVEIKTETDDFCDDSLSSTPDNFEDYEETKPEISFKSDDTTSNQANTQSQSSNEVPAEQESTRGLYPCNLCHRKYSQLSSLKFHTTKIHKVKLKSEKIRRFSCDICGKMFTRQESIPLHKKTVHQLPLTKSSKSRPFTCDLCGLGFTRKSTIQCHKKIVHKLVPKPKIKPFSCDMCTTRFSRMDTMFVHKKKIHGVEDKSLRPTRPYNCKICSAKSISEEGLSRHMKTAHNMELEEGLQCSQCSQQFNTRRLLTLHIYEEHTKHKKSLSFQNHLATIKSNPDLADDNVDTSCVVCEEKFTSWNSLRIHLTHRHEKNCTKKLLKCYFCGDSFKYEQTVWAHLKSSKSHDLTHIEFSCDHPNHIGFRQWGFKTPAELEAHLSKEHSESVMIKCVDCNWPFVDKNVLDIHRLVHLPKVNKKHQCPVCHGFFLKVDSLQNHYNTVHGANIKFFRCPICTWSFSTKAGYALHLKTHNTNETESAAGDDEFKCSVCSKCFPTAIQLKNHKRTNHVTKQCQECGKVLQANNLSYHMRKTHKRGEPHLCTLCGKVYYTRAGLKRHMAFHGQYNYTCQFCGKQSRSSQHLKRHIMRMHKDKRYDEAPEELAVGAVSGSSANTNRAVTVGNTNFKDEQHVEMQNDS